jgi:hypothetical protein
MVHIERTWIADRVTSHLEGDRTWSDFFERAIEREVERARRLTTLDSGTRAQAALLPGRSIA